MKLSGEEFYTLNWLYNYPEYSASIYDCYLHSIKKSILNDLKEKNLVRKKFFGWEITSKGIKKVRKYYDL